MQTQIASLSPFTGGLNTEITKITDAPTYTVDELNCQNVADGSKARRYGMGIEDDGVSIQESSAITSMNMVTGFYWNNSDKAGRDVIVVQVGNLLKFFENTKPFSSKYITSLDISEYIKDADNFKKSYVQMATGNGILFVVSRYMKGIYITLNETVASATLVTLKYRDLEGVEDNLNIDEQPTTLSKEHNYNLLNQGWDNDKINKFKTGNGNKYPSNNLQWFLGRNNSTGEFDTSSLLKVYFGTTPAPKGKYILDFFNRDRNAASGLTGLPIETIKEGIVDVSYLSGRFFYLVNNTLLFSQTILEDVRNIGKCYQDADPTSEEINDIVDTDGGTINFQNIGVGICIEKFSLGLLVFGKDAVYSITTSTGSPFTATDYGTNLVTNAGAYNRGSIVDVEGSILYWSPLGIYQIGTDTLTGTSAQATNIISQTIQTWYNALPQFSKQNAKGSYDYTNRRVIWYYPTDKKALWRLDSALILDIRNGAFMPQKFADGGCVVSTIALNNPYKIQPSIALWAGDDEVFADSDEVIAKEYNTEYDEYSAVTHIIYLDEDSKLYFGDYNSRDFFDWQNKEFESYMVSFPMNMQSTYIKKTAPILQPYFTRTEEEILKDGSYIAPSSCLIRGRWNWSDNSKGNRWDIEQQGYIPYQKNFLDFKYVNGKIRLRGKGEALQLAFYSDSNKDFILSGLNIVVRS